GKRGASYWRVHKYKFGQWEQTFFELISERVSDVKGEIRGFKPARHSPMRNLFGALIGHFAQVGFRERPPEVSAGEWDFNLMHAERILLKNRRTLSNLTVQDICDSLAAGKKKCQACGTPILVGFKLEGKKRRSRQWCDDACKKTTRRRHPA